MRIEGDHQFAAPREVVWKALLDPQVLARTMPGCEKLERSSENEFRGVLTVKVGPVNGQFQGSLRLTDLRPREGYHMVLDGNGPAGFMKGEGDLTLTDSGGGTNLRYALDAQVGGRVAGVGQRLLDSSARVIARQGLEGLERQLAAIAAAKSRGEPANAAPLPPGQGRMATRFALGLAGELIPPRWRPWLVAGGVLLVALLVAVLLRACVP